MVQGQKKFIEDTRRPCQQKDDTLWLFKNGYVMDLAWDFHEWHWGKTFNHAQAPFFCYTTKRGYTQEMSKHATTASANVTLTQQGLQTTYRNRIFKFMWHSTDLPKWALSFGSWLTKVSRWGVGSWEPTNQELNLVKIALESSLKHKATVSGSARGTTTVALIQQLVKGGGPWRLVQRLAADTPWRLLRLHGGTVLHH